jgi:hypothetical protein
MLAHFLQTISTIRAVEVNEGPLFPAPKLRERETTRGELGRQAVL